MKIKIYTSHFISKSFFLIFLFSFSNFSFGQSIKPSEEKPLFQHLNEVNKEWSKQNVDFKHLQQPMTFEKDEDRIRLHLMMVENILRKKNISNLSPQQISNRLHHLDILKSYWQRGVFPKNKFHNQRQPYFVDQKGTACAVGYLVKKSGATDFVEKIRLENNYAYIHELQNIYPELKGWATENGFSLEELAWIQPGYPPQQQQYNEVGNGGGVVGKINVMKTSEDGGSLFMAGDFSEVDGVAANSIIKWDGSNFYPLGNGVEGEVFAIAEDSFGKIYIGGNFILNDDPNYSNIAYWNGNEWEGVQEGDMQGTVFALHFDGNLYAGGDFQLIDNQPINYLAKLSGYPEKEWNNYARIYNTNTLSYDTISNALAVDGPVKAFENVSGHLLVAGDFLNTAPGLTDGIIQSFPTHNLAYWYNENWEVGFDEGIDDLESVFYGSDGKIYTGGDLGNEYDNDLGIFNAGFWNYDVFSPIEEGENKVHGFVEHDENIFAFGNIIPFFSHTYSPGFVWVGGEYSQSTLNGLGGVFDKQVRAAASFQDQIYFAGDFTTAGGSEVNGLASSPFDGIISSVTEGVFEKNKIQVFNVENQLNVRYENLEKNSTLLLFNLQGQLLKSVSLEQGDQTLEIQLSNWAGGMYVFQVVNESGKQAGKFHVY